MRFVVGPLLIGLGLLLAAGCALPERTLSRADDLGFRQKKSTQPRRSEKTTASNEIPAEERLAFRKAAVGDDRETESFHSAPSSNLTLSDGNSDEKSKTAPLHSKTASLHTEEWDQDHVSSAGFRADMDKSDNPVEMLGVEAVSAEKTRNDVSSSAAISNTPKPLHTSPRTSQPRADLERLIERFEQELSVLKPDGDLRHQNEFVRKQAQLRLLYLLAERQEDALAAIAGIESTQQEFWQQIVWAISNSLDSEQFPEASERAIQTVPPLSSALRLMREQAALTIKNMTFCRKISYFGNYEQFPRNEFTPGYEVLLYTEIENFVSTPTVDGEFRTSLKSLIEIADSDGRIVWTKGFPSTEDFCRNPRRDYFHNYQFSIPENLSTGAYTLKLTIVDELSRKRVSHSLNFILK